MGVARRPNRRGHRDPRGTPIGTLATRDRRRQSRRRAPAARYPRSHPRRRSRSVATFHAIDNQLTEDGYVYRYRPDERPLGEAEGAFLVCGFWMALAWAQQGHPIAAARWFERNRAACGPPGLFAEEFDVTQRQLRGNLPQAFVHALLLECAATLDTRPGDEGFDDQ